MRLVDLVGVSQRTCILAEGETVGVKLSQPRDRQTEYERLHKLLNQQKSEKLDTMSGLHTRMHTWWIWSAVYSVWGLTFAHSH